MLETVGIIRERNIQMQLLEVACGDYHGTDCQVSVLYKARLDEMVVYIRGVVMSND